MSNPIKPLYHRLSDAVEMSSTYQAAKGPGKWDFAGLYAPNSQAQPAPEQMRQAESIDRLVACGALPAKPQTPPQGQEVSSGEIFSRKRVLWTDEIYVVNGNPADYQHLLQIVPLPSFKEMADSLKKFFDKQRDSDYNPYETVEILDESGSMSDWSACGDTSELVEIFDKIIADTYKQPRSA